MSGRIIDQRHTAHPFRDSFCRAASCSVLSFVAILLIAAQAWGRDASVTVTGLGDGTHEVHGHGEFAYCPDYPPGQGTDYGHIYVRRC
jgi:hypothetical protein